MNLNDFVGVPHKVWSKVNGYISLKQIVTRGSRCRADGWFFVSGGGNIALSDDVSIGRESQLNVQQGSLIIEHSARILHHAEVRAVRGRVRIGSFATIGPYAVLKSGHMQIDVGDRVWVAQNCIIEGNVSIGNDVILGPFVHVVAGDHGFSETNLPINQQGAISAPVLIEEDCWIGSGAVITKGVTIGRGSVIGARAVVTKNIPPYSVAVGIPATVIKSRLKA